MLLFGAHDTYRASVEGKQKNKNTAVTNLKCDISLILTPLEPEERNY